MDLELPPEMPNGGDDDDEEDDDDDRDGLDDSYDLTGSWTKYYSKACLKIPSQHVQYFQVQFRYS